MTLFLNILFVVVSVLYMTGRLYEISTITDLTTNFLTANAVVTGPLMMLLICIIAVCCGIIIFSPEKGTKKIRQMPVGIFGIMAGIFIAAAGVVNSANCFKVGGFILYHGMEILGGIGLVLLGIMNIRGRSKEKIPVVLTLMIPIGTCMNSVLHEIKPLSDTDFLMRSLAGLLTLIFFMLLFKMAYKPDKMTKMLLYIAALINFVFTGIGSLCAVLGSIMTSTVNFNQLLYNVGFIFIGLYSMFIAFFITPEKLQNSDGPVRAEKPKLTVKPTKKPEEKKPAVKQEEPKADFYNFEATGNISKATIEELFARKDRAENAMKTAATLNEEKYTEYRSTAQIYVPTVTASNTVSESKENPDKTTQVPLAKTTFRPENKRENKKTVTKKTVYKAPK